jgi:hypothetical protein
MGSVSGHYNPPIVLWGTEGARESVLLTREPDTRLAARVATLEKLRQQIGQVVPLCNTRG